MGFYHNQLRHKLTEIQNIVNDLQGNGVYKRDAKGSFTTEVRQDVLNQLFEAQRQAANYAHLEESEIKKD